MNLYNVKNIKDLPQLEQILPGNFIVVENFTGTNKLDFDDFVIGPRNTSFANQVFNDILSLSSYSISLSSTVNNQLTALSSFVSTVSTNQDTFQKNLNNGTYVPNTLNKCGFGAIKMLKEFITLDVGVTAIDFTFKFPTDTLFDLTNSDVNIVPRDIYSLNLNFAWTLYGTPIINNDNTSTYTIRLSTNNFTGIERRFNVTVMTI